MPDLTNMSEIIHPKKTNADYQRDYRKRIKDRIHAAQSDPAHEIARNTSALVEKMDMLPGHLGASLEGIVAEAVEREVSRAIAPLVEKIETLLSIVRAETMIVADGHAPIEPVIPAHAITLGPDGKSAA